MTQRLLAGAPPTALLFALALCLLSCSALDTDRADLSGAELTRRCNRDDAASCYVLATRLQASDPARAESLAARACEEGLVRGCTARAILLRSRDQESALALFERSCKRGDPQACNHGASIYWRRHRRRQGGMAQLPFAPTSKAGDPSNKPGDPSNKPGGPANAARAAETGKSGSSARDLERAESLYGRGCRADYAMSCANLALLRLSTRTLEGKARASAHARLRLGCEQGGARFCSALGRQLALESPPRTSEAGELFARACKDGFLEACSDHGVLLEAASQRQAALRMHRRACMGGIGRACARAGWLLEQSAARASNKQGFAPASSADDSTGPTGSTASTKSTESSAASTKGSPKTDALAAARALYQRGCRERDRASCARLARSRLVGSTTARGRMEARAILKHACLRPRLSSCAALDLLGPNAIQSLRAQAAPMRWRLEQACLRSRASCVDLELARARGFAGSEPAPGEAIVNLRKLCVEALAVHSKRSPSSSSKSPTKPDAASDSSLESCAWHGELAARHDRAAEAEKSWRAACDGGSARACAARARLQLRRDRGDVEARKTLEESCAAGAARACVDRGDLAMRPWRGRSSNSAQAERSYRRACELDWPQGCSRLGYLALQRGEHARAARLLGDACAGEDGYGCMALGRLKLEGKVGARPDEARAYLARGCALGQLAACTAHAVDLLKQAGRGEDAESRRLRGRAMSQLRSSCGQGHALGCRNLAALLYRAGRRDRARAVLLRACKLGDRRSCRR